MIFLFMDWQLRLQCACLWVPLNPLLKVPNTKCFRVSSGDKMPLEENYEKKLDDTRIPKLRQEIQPMRRRSVPERLNHYSTNVVQFL